MGVNVFYPVDKLANRRRLLRACSVNKQYIRCILVNEGEDIIVGKAAA